VRVRVSDCAFYFCLVFKLQTVKVAQLKLMNCADQLTVVCGF
jgi:hypothetical protein